MAIGVHVSSRCIYLTLRFVLGFSMDTRGYTNGIPVMSRFANLEMAQSK